MVESQAAYVFFLLFKRFLPNTKGSWQMNFWDQNFLPNYTAVVRNPDSIPSLMSLRNIIYKIKKYILTN